jgi:hypothetical protein
MAKVLKHNQDASTAKVSFLAKAATQTMCFGQ